jgi:hypothetical protein
VIDENGTALVPVEYKGSAVDRDPIPFVDLEDIPLAYE